MPHVESIRRSAPALLLLLAASTAGAESVTVCASNPLAIADNGDETLVTFDIDAPAGAIVEEVELTLQLAHPWVGDLVVDLSAGGRSVRVIDRVQFAGNQFGCGGDDIDARFTDAAPAPPDPQCSPTAVPTIAGDVLPAEPLGAFIGDPAGGQWTLAIADDAPFDAGVFQSACLTISVAVSSCRADFNLDGVVGGADLAQLLGFWGVDCSVSFPCADVDDDGFVTSNDLALLLGSWGTCP